MRGRWTILALLFAVRATMGLQYQSVAAVAPLVARDFSVGLADIGFLIGLYLAPGIAVAYPGGAIARRFGDKPVVLLGLACMFVGGVLMALVPSWHAQLGGRLLAGLGGVLLNVLMSKMVTDWFAGREIGTAMGIFVNSWPVGVALALVALPVVGATYGVAVTYLVTSAAIALGLIILAVFYTAPPPTGAAEVTARPGGQAVAAIVVAGAVWSIYNTGFAMIFGFGLSMLTERGWSIVEAGSTVSIVLWLAIISVPLGGVLADKVKSPDRLVVATLLVFAAALVAAARTGAVVPAFAALGLICGLPAGAIMAMPSRVLGPATRAVGMGLFFTIYYLGMFAAPIIAGYLASLSGSAATAFDFGAAVLLAAAALTRTFRSLAEAAGRDSDVRARLVEP